jgi:hypothetical protein
MAHITKQSISATDLARAILAVRWPRAARCPDGTFNSALPANGGPLGEAQ